MFDYLVSFLYNQDWLSIVSTCTALAGTMCAHYAIRTVNYKRAEAQGVNKRGPLPDVVHQLVRFKPVMGMYTDFVIRYMIFGVILLCLVVDRVDIGLHIVKLFCCLKWFRTFCMSMTILPDISGKGHDTWLHGGTNDLMFSGHVMLSTLLERSYNKFFLPETLFWLPVLLNTFNIVNTVATHRHYTIDVVVGFVVTYSFFELSGSLFSFPEKVIF